mmetsp:Transcript_10970/g.15251  ORF Transcript_10970/g.15251 Transcript_10970/m.15251 type:complete len:552 (+) Transcript_10970:157-1812(+)|eukprot:CAMPEP_0184492018 /NCGR_PEP_ID=MMETSP0113_2-20130426/22046_1 /TAXON_ID=91329 /ORGANISM="Norrisiella sphaerica, Strain BC52" /LENGTH=551 /DNA_ID=CAMNT_0026876629 /DNA_START=130 /DNA_END=1785 /DNA_ORIENTATION=-
MYRPAGRLGDEKSSHARVFKGVIGVALLAAVLIVTTAPSKAHIGIEINSSAQSTQPRRHGRRTEYIHVTSGNVVRTNSFLTPNDTLTSPSGNFHANLSRNGVFRIYKHDSYAGERVIYELGAPPPIQTQMGLRPGRRAEGDFYALLLNDGNMVIQKGTDPRHKLNTIDSSKIYRKQGKGKYKGVLHDDGSFIVYNETNHPLWWSTSSTLFMRDFIEEGDVLVSPQGKHFAQLTSAGLLTYEGYGPSDPNKKKTFEWLVKKNKLGKRKGARLFAMIQDSGDFQIFSAMSPDDKVKKITMRSRTNGLKRQAIDMYFALMHDEGELTLYGGRGADMNAYSKIWSNYEACLYRAEVAVAQTMSYLPMAGPIYKELSAVMYAFKPWCKPMAKQRMTEGLRSLGVSLGVGAVPFAFKIYQQAREKGWRTVLRIKKKDSDPSHYDVLGVRRTASDEDIKDAYKKISQEWHPDKFQNDAQKKLENDIYLRKVTVAYETLVNEQKRVEYDAGLPMFDFEGPGKFFKTLGFAMMNCLGIRDKDVIGEEVIHTSDALEAGLD